jgi:ABC-2 type transport system permease protein
VTTVATSSEHVAPGVLSLGLERTKLELKSFFRNKEAAWFTFALPVMMLVLFSLIFTGTVGDTEVKFNQVFIAGIIASGIMATSFQSLAISVAIERHDGTLKRLAGTPMPKAAYFIGKLGMTLVTGVVQTAIMLTIAVTLYGLSLPHDFGRWFTLLYVFLLGNAACSVLGIAYSALPRNGKGAAAVVTPPFLFLQFVSGVFFVFTDLPKLLQDIASLFPLRWMASGLRYVFLPDSFKQIEPGHHWNLVAGAAVLALWLLVAFVLCVRTFRFTDEA